MAKLDFTNVHYMDYPLPKGQQLKAFSIATVDIGKPYIAYVAKSKEDIPKKHIIYGFNPVTGSIKQNMLYIIK